jgi:hypothetical protein
VRGGLAWAGAAAATAALAGGCGSDDAPPPSACNSGPRFVLGALRAAPGRVVLDGGTLISTCVRRSRGQGDIQNLGFTYVAVANTEVRMMPRRQAAAVQLGFLVGAVRRGANKTNGVQLELVRRLEQVAGVDGPPGPRRAGYRRGVAAGEDHG